MDPIIASTTATTGLKALGDIITAVNTTEQKLDKLDLKKQIVELSELLIDTKSSIIEQKAQLLNKDEEINKLKQALADKAKFKFQKYYYYEYDDNDTCSAGPFCSNCYETKNIKVHLIPQKRGCWHCASCNKDVFGDDWDTSISWSESIYNPFDYV